MQVVDPDRFRSLPRQWLLSRTDDNSLDKQAAELLVTVHASGGWRLAGTSQLTAHVGDGPGRHVVLTGAAVDADHPDLAMGPLAHDLAQLDPTSLEARLPALSGNYNLFVFEHEAVKTYTDPAAACAVYIDRQYSRLASSPALLGRYEVREPLSQWFAAKAHNNWVPGSVTLLEGVEALPANHMLTLPDWEIARFWPRENDLEQARVQTSVGSAIAQEMRRIIRFVASDSRKAYLSLTGGRDSRVNLAAARDVLKAVECFTLRTSGEKAADARIAKRLADQVGLPLRVIDCPPAPKALLQHYDRQCAGQALGGGRAVIGGCAELVDGPAVHVNGGLGVLLKNYYGSTYGPRSAPVRLGELLTDFESPPALVREGVEQWFETVQTLPAQVQRTLMYLEQRAARWMGPIDLGGSIFYDAFSPYASRRIALLAAFASDPLLERGRLHEAVIRELWPELLAEPFTLGRGRLVRLMPRGLKERLRLVKGLIAKRSSAH